MAAIHSPSTWRILILILGIGVLLVPDSEAAKGWTRKEIMSEDTDELTITCPARFHIIITHGEYGNRDHNCSDVFNQYNLALKCNYKELCHFPKVDEGMKTSCPEGVKKYLNLYYDCMLGPNKLHFNLLTREEDRDFFVTCPVNTRIYIDEAYYNYDEEHSCTFNVKEDIISSCWGHECSFYDVFDYFENSPCDGLAKELMITHICKEEEQLTTPAFKGRPTLIECPNEYIIDIFSANYSDPLHDCKPNDVDAHIKKWCSSKQTCTIKETTFFDFPSGCESDLLELLITYRCVRTKETRKSTVFENGLVDLSCFFPQKIKIIHASYGDKKKMCGNKNIMERMIEECNGKMRCCGTANAKMLGDSTCSKNDTQKLMVTYECIDDGDMFKQDEEDECEKIRFKVSASFGELTSHTYSEMDRNLILMIGTSLPHLKQISMESYEGIIEYMKDIPSLEVVPGSSEKRIDSYTSAAHGIVDTISRTLTKYEAIAWYNTFINDKDIVKQAHVDIEYLAEVVTETGMPVKDFETLFVADGWKVVRNIDIAILRFPDIQNPYFLVYHINIVAWRVNKRVLFYEMAEGGLKCLFKSIKFRPNKEYLVSLTPDVIDSAQEEAESLFD